MDFIAEASEKYWSSFIIFSVQLESSKSFLIFQWGDQGNTFFCMYDSAVRNEMTGLTQWLEIVYYL